MVFGTSMVPNSLAVHVKLKWRGGEPPSRIQSVKMSGFGVQGFLMALNPEPYSASGLELRAWVSRQTGVICPILYPHRQASAWKGIG